MTIPSASNYPATTDTDNNLYLVHDGLRMKLVDDYNPGDSTITVDGDTTIMSRFPSTGLITLTEQQSDPQSRAISFYYSGKTTNTFTGLILLPGFTDVFKPGFFTDVTQNVMADHHNNIKNAIIAIENFVGVKGTLNRATITGRVAFLMKILFTPRAWFSVDKQIGLVPLTVTFTNQSFHLGDCDIECLWDFGDETSSTTTCMSGVSSITIPSVISGPSIVSVTSVVPISDTNDIIENPCSMPLSKTYTRPGKYTVKLTVTNPFGTDTVTFEQLVNARIQAPNEAVINFEPNVDQIMTSGLPNTGGPYTTPPKLRSAVNTFVNIDIPTGNYDQFGGNFTNAGELLDNCTNMPIDPIVEYTWILGDDLPHSSANTATALYSIGGLYDLALRVDTAFGDYRITTYPQSIDVVENINLWLWIEDNTGSITANEFGLTSETFKTATNSQLTVPRDNSFLLGTNNQDQALAEFGRNVGFAPNGTASSGTGGSASIYWASGGNNLANQQVNVAQFNGFSQAYSVQSPIPNRPWNWLVLNSPTDSYFLFGQNPTADPNTNPSFQVMTTFDLSQLTYSNVALTNANYEQGAGELTQHVSQYDNSGIPTNGYFAVYRTAWLGQNGYILRNSGVNEFFRISSFYQTVGTLTDPVQAISKLPDMAGTAKFEGQLVPLTNGLFFFNNSGDVSAFNVASGVWETSNPSVGTVNFSTLQDTSVPNFASLSNTLVAASDGDRIAYLSFDYSSNAFIKFNGANLTFTSGGARPAGSQFLMGIY